MQCGVSDNHTSLHPAKPRAAGTFVQTPFSHLQKNRGCSAQSRTRREPSLWHTANSPNHPLISSLGSIPISLGEGYYHLEALYASSFQTLLYHFPWAGSHFRFASWDLAPGLIPAPEPSFMSEWAGWSRGTLQCALTQVVLGKLLPDFCKEVESDRVKAEWWQSSEQWFPAPSDVYFLVSEWHV